MRGITIKLSDATLLQLEREARATGRSVAALVRDRVDAPRDVGASSVHNLTADLAGSVSGRRESATNRRRRFRQS